MENKEILSASNPMPVLGAFAGELNRAGTFDSGKEFLKGLFKNCTILKLYFYWLF